MILRKNKAASGSVISGLAAGTATALAVIITGAAVISKLIHSAILEEEMLGYGVMVILILAPFIGGQTACKKIGHRKIAVIGIVGILLFIILLGMTAILFKGEYSAVGVTGLLILCGCTLTILADNSRNRGGKRKKYRVKQ